MSAALRRAAPWAVGVACVVAAWFVALATPADTAAWDPFVVEARVGEPATGRNIAVTIDEVTRTDGVVAGPWRADGSWVVVDLSAEAVVTERGAALNNVELIIDGRSYRSTERRENMLGQRLAVGIARSGSIAFEIPPSASGTAVLQLGLDGIDSRADSLITLPIDLDALPVSADRELVAPHREGAS